MFDACIHQKQKRNKKGKNNIFSVMADECADCSNQVQLSICIRYCYTENDVCYVTEDFCDFVELVKMNATSVYNFTSDFQFATMNEFILGQW
jgi:hypothetical protein